MRRFILVLLILVLLCFLSKHIPVSEKNEIRSVEYSALNKQLSKGWNTWNTRSVLSHVLLPEGFTINLQLQNNNTNEILKEALIGRREEGKEKVTPGPRTYDGSYTELDIEWNDQKMKVQSAAEGNDIRIVIKPLNFTKSIDLLIYPEILWSKTGTITTGKNKLIFSNDSGDIVFTIKGKIKYSNATLICCQLSENISISTRRENDITDIENFIEKSEKKHLKDKAKYISDSLLYDVMQNVLAWDIIYEPENERVIAPVSRIWNCNWNGWVLFDWDTYFASYMFALNNKELAYSNAIAITKEITQNGFIPNFGSGICRSEDRSQPPVGSLIVKEIYKIHQEEWFLNEVFDELLSWNRWWEKNRDIDGYLCWGSNPYNTDNIPEWLSKEVGKKQGAMWESGLDNSPMYDNVPFDTLANIMMLADVGLMSLYISDCHNLAEIAKVLDKPEIEKELIERGKKYSMKLKTLWNEEFGLYLNKNLVTGEFSYRLSPTLFYPLLAKVPNQKQAECMISEHFYNSEEFWGDWIIPSIARNDSAFVDNNYWRGRIWAPMNFLVYLGMRNYDLPQTRNDLVQKSAQLILKSWIEEKHVYENYNSVNGQGGDVASSDMFYHWGGLLSFISIIENGFVPPPEKALERIKTCSHCTECHSELDSESYK